MGLIGDAATWTAPVTSGRAASVGSFAASQSTVVTPQFGSLVNGAEPVGTPVDLEGVLSAPLAPTLAEVGTGAIASGVISAASPIATGYNAVIANLVRAGYSAVQLSAVLAGNFALSQSATVNELIYLHYDVDGVAEVLATTFTQTPLQVATTLQALDYSPTQIAHSLLTAFP
jgi:hypothetical protein